MIGVADILQHIAQELSCYTAEELTPLVEGAPVDCPLDMHLCITNDIEGTELNYLLQYGQGHTLYFRLRDYEHGESLANDLGAIMKGICPEISPYAVGEFDAGDQLYLFLHIRHVVPNVLTLEFLMEAQAACLTE